MQNIATYRITLSFEDFCRIAPRILLLLMCMLFQKPRKSFYQPDFIAANQEARANNLMTATHKQQVVDQIRADIRDFKTSKNLETVIVLWTANTERYCDVTPGLHDTAEHLLAGIERNENEISPSTLFAVASVLEKVRAVMSFLVVTNFFF